MTSRRPARPTSRRIRIRWHRVAALLVVGAGIGAALGLQLAPPSSTAAATIDVLRREPRGSFGGVGSTVPETPEVANLDPALLDALRLAAADASNDGVELVVTSGWRSPEYQAQLLQEAVSKYGSVEEAARWVATPEMSPHVSGDAIDVGDSAIAWLSERGADYGLCQIYANEPWHYELRPAARHDSCPPMYADPTRDPRMQR